MAIRTPLRPPPMPSAVEVGIVAARLDKRAEQTDREILEELADATAELRKLGALVLAHEAQLQAHDARLDRHGARLAIVEDRVDGLALHTGRVPPVPPPRPPFPSDHFEDVDDDERTSPGGRVVLTPERAEARDRTRFGRWYAAQREAERTASDAAITRAARDTLGKGASKAVVLGVVATITGVAALLWSVLKSYIEKATHH